MKKIIIGIFAVLLGVGLASWNKVGEKKRLSYFWAYDVTGTSIIYPNSVPPTTNPVSCGPPYNTNCAIEYSTYVQVLISINPTVFEYRPAGAFINLFKKP